MAERAAAAIVAVHRASLPDLHHLVVLVPDLHAVSRVARALCRAAELPALLLPRITTLAAWAAEVPLARPLAAASARAVTLYDALMQREWLRQADIWAIAQELSGLFEELTRYNVALAENLDDFSHRMEAAYQARPGASLRFEAQLVHELWWAMSRGTPELAPAAAYQMRLARLAHEPTLPLYAVGLSRLTQAERAFFERYAQCAPVTVFEAARGDQDALAATLAAAWPGAVELELRARAARLSAAHPQSALKDRLRVFGAASAEQEAQAIDVTVREWLLAGKKSIAIVEQDRVVARRARALLERAEVLVADEAGWALSTTSAATALGRWLDIVASDAYHQDLLDLMKSPFAFHELARGERLQAVWRLERYVREANVIAGVNRYAELARRHDDPQVADMVRRVERGLVALKRNRKPLAGWLAALDASLAEIGVRAGLEADPAGEQLLELLASRARELEGSGTLFSFAGWRRWLAGEIEAATFLDRGVESPVIFTYLAATRLRRFDAVLICGCDAQHLPGNSPAPRFFNQAVRAELGLPTQADDLRETEAQLSALIACSGVVLCTWQRRLGDEDNLLSPLLARLVALHGIAYGSDLDDGELASRLQHSEVASPDELPLPAPTLRSSPLASADLLPREFSASAYNALITCPYQFYERYMLKLGELDEVQELIDKRDYGNLLHGVLAKFHRTYPVVSEIPAGAAHEALAQLSAEAFREAVADNYLARAWLIQWQALIPEYLTWQCAREAEGWRWHAAEAKRRIEIITPEGRTLVLSGRLDRVDMRGGELAVVDYKTSSRNLLRSKLQSPGEDVQLAVYALLWGGPVAAAFFLAMERDGIRPVPQGDLEQLVSENRDRIALMYDMLQNGAQLPAHGADSACERCEARGLCRKDYWS